jgi:RNA polymerase sigma-70 factor (ECF subfamily)
MLRERGAAEDAVQDAAFKAWRSVRRLRSDTTSIRPWFLTIVANHCRSVRRNRWWRVLRLANLAPDQARGGTAAEDRLDLERAITGLPAKYRLVLALRYYLDLPIAEVAEVLDLTVPATKSRIRRALKAMGIVLEALGEQR